MPVRRSSPTPAARLWLSRGGRFEVPGGTTGDLEPKDALLLAYLAIEGPAPRSRLAALLWPDVDEERARGNLRQRLLRLNRAAGVELVTGHPQARLADGVEHDLAETHELLEGIASEAAGGLSEWLDAQRQRRSRAWAAALAGSSARAEAEGRLDEALAQACAWVDVEPVSEDAHRRVMKLHYLRGDAGAALAAFQRCAKLLHDELGVKPGRETLELKQQVERAAPAVRVAPVPPAVPITMTRPPRLVGRDTELAMLARAWDERQAFLVLGEAGMGKSRLLAEFAFEHPRVIAAQARPGDAGVPFATLARLLRIAMAGRPHGTSVAGPTQLARVLPELAPATGAAAEGQPLQLRQAIEAVLSEAGREGIRGVVLDDVHFADEASLDMLRALVAGEPACDLRWGFAQRPGEASSGAQALRETLEDGLALATVGLAPLDVRAMATLVDSLGVPGLDGTAIADRLVRHTGGNPMFALETLKQAAAAGASFESLPRPATVGTLIERRLRQITPPAIALARVAAVAGVDFSIDLAEHVLKTPAVALADAWNELESAQVLKGAAFAHDLVFEATLRSMPEAIATHTHGSIADWLERAGGEPARVAAHWEATSTPQRALPWLHKAAERAQAAMRPRESCDFLMRAADIEAHAATPEQAFETLARIAERRFQVAPDRSLLPLIDRLDALAATPAQQIDALQARAAFSIHYLGPVADGIAAIERAIALATKEGLDRRRVESTLRATTLYAMQGDDATAARRAEELLPDVRRWPPDRERCDALGHIAFALARAGRIAQAVRLFDESAADAQAIRYPVAAIVVLGNAALGLVRLHRPADALARLERSDALCTAHDQLEGSRSSNDWIATRALRLIGRHSEALRRAEVAVETMRERSPETVSNAIVARANVWLDLGQVARAMQDRELAQRAAARPSLKHEVAVLDLRLAIEANVRAADAPARGRSLQEEPLQLYTELTAKLLLIALAPPTEAPAAVRDVVAAARRSELRGLEASALSRLAVAEMGAGDADSAATHARLAVELAGELNTEDLSWPAIVRNAVVVLQWAGGAYEARALALRGEAWLRDTAERQVPSEFRESFLARNPANRELLALARRMK